MAQLLELALQYQHALDGLSDSSWAAASEAGARLRNAVKAARNNSTAQSSLVPIILRTQLATSMVSNLERIRWDEVTP